MPQLPPLGVGDLIVAADDGRMFNSIGSHVTYAAIDDTRQPQVSDVFLDCGKPVYPVRIETWWMSLLFYVKHISYVALLLRRFLLAPM